MKHMSGIAIAAAVLVLIGLGSVQGARLDHLRDSEEFYRWVQGATMQYSFDGSLIDAETLARYGEQPLDNEFFEQVIAVGEATLPELDGPVDPNAPIYAQRRLVRIVQGGANDAILWDWAKGPETAELRAQFAALNRDDLLVSAGTEYSVADMYAQGTAPSLGNVIFGFRQLAANLLWLEADEDFHVGKIHRIMPMMHTIVATDPSFIEAYQVGAWHYAYNLTAKMPDTPEELKVWSDRYGDWVGAKEQRYYEGEALLKQGIRNNPRNSHLYFDLGYAIIMEKQNDPERAVPYLREATRYQHERYMPRTLARAYEQAGRYEEAITEWQAYMDNVDPDSEVAQRFIRYAEAMIHEAQANELEDQLKSLEDLLEDDPLGPMLDQAEELQEEIDMHREEAQRIWGGIIAEHGDDGRAYAQILRNRARALHSEGRSYEAVGLLDHARWNVSTRLFQELSDTMTDIKLEEGMRLTLSEMAQLIRNERNQAAREAREGTGEPPMAQTDELLESEFEEITEPEAVELDASS